MEKSSALLRVTETLAACFVAAALALIQTLIGGTRLLFCLPSFALLAIAAILTLPSLRRIKPEPDRLCLWSSAAFFGYVLTRAFFSPVPYLARSDIYPVLGGLLLYLLVACIFTSARTRMFLLLFLVVLALGHAIVGAIQFRDGNNYMPIAWLQRAHYGRRASGFYICPNHLAGLLEVLGVFALSIACWSRWPVWAKLLTGYGAGICYAGVVLTGSRGGYLSTVTSLLVLALLSVIVLARTGSGLAWKVSGGAAIAVLALGLALLLTFQRSDFLADRARNTFDVQNSRLDMWRAGIQQWKLDPVFGTGSGTYLYYGRQFRTDRVQADPVHAHNDYIELLSEYGVIGAIGFLLFLGAHMQRGIRTFVRVGPKRVAVAPRLLSNSLALNIGALAAVAAYIVHSVFDFNLHIPANLLLLALVFGILANDGLERESNRPTVSRPSVLWRAALVTLAVIVLLQCIRLLPGEYFAEKARTAVRDYHPLDALYFAMEGIAHEKENPNLYFYLGMARLFYGDMGGDLRARHSFYSAGLQALDQARSLAPRDETFVLQLAFTYDALGRFTEAEWMYQEALALDPNSKHIQKCYRDHIQEWLSPGSVQPHANE
jgi:O-antigen ligase